MKKKIKDWLNRWECLSSEDGFREFYPERVTKAVAGLLDDGEEILSEMLKAFEALDLKDECPEDCDEDELQVDHCTKDGCSSTHVSGPTGRLIILEGPLDIILKTALQCEGSNEA